MNIVHKDEREFQRLLGLTRAMYRQRNYRSNLPSRRSSKKPNSTRVVKPIRNQVKIDRDFPNKDKFQYISVR